MRRLSKKKILKYIFNLFNIDENVILRYERDIVDNDTLYVEILTYQYNAPIKYDIILKTSKDTINMRYMKLDYLQTLKTTNEKELIFNSLLNGE